MDVEKRAEMLGGEVRGRVDGNAWFCLEGHSGTEPDEHQASLALYFHLRSDHQPVTVMAPGDVPGESAR